jgi:hypothetical protein
LVFRILTDTTPEKADTTPEKDTTTERADTTPEIETKTTLDITESLSKSIAILSIEEAPKKSFTEFLHETLNKLQEIDIEKKFVLEYIQISLNISSMKYKNFDEFE